MEDKSESMKRASLYIIFFIIFVPFVTSLVAAGLKFKNDRQTAMTCAFYTLALIVLMHAVGLIVCMNMFIDVKTGSQILGVLLVTIYGFVSYLIYRKNDYRWPKVIKIINFVLVITVSISLVLVAVFDDSFNQF
jgi:hypothetical protein